MVQTIGSIPFGTQLDWLWAELQGPEKKTWQNFLTNPNLITPAEYATAFEKTYERADGQHLEKRQNYATDVFKAFSNNNLSSISPNAVATVNYLTDKGMTLPQAAGVTGNLMAESGFEIDPDAYNPSGGGIGAYGIAQWRDDRQTGLKDYYNRMRPEEEKQMVMPTEKDDFLTMLTKGASGLYNAMTNPKEGQLLSRGEQFARALDPLVMPELRMGDKITANALAQKKYEETANNRNRTINVLKGLAAQGDEIAKQVLASVEARALLPKDAMTIYYRQKFAKPTKTATQKTGAEINAEQGTNYPPEALFNVFNTGEIKEVRQGPLVEMTGEKAAEKGMAEYYVKRYTEIVNDGMAGYDLQSTNAMLAGLMSDPDFTSGAFADTKMNLSKILVALGADPERAAGIGSKEAFNALSSRLILDLMGGSLGAGFSDGDRKFVTAMGPQLGTTQEGNLKILLFNELIAQRQIDIKDFAVAYVNEIDPATGKKRGALDSEFEKALSEWAKENRLEDEFNRRMGIQ